MKCWKLKIESRSGYTPVYPGIPGSQILFEDQLEFEDILNWEQKMMFLNVFERFYVTSTLLGWIF